MSQTNTSDALSYIARTFAEAYYGLLVDAENLSKLHIFYQLDAVFTRGDEALGPQGASTTTGLEGIKKELAAFHNQVRNSEVTLKVLDSQYSVNQGIIITAIGSFNRVEGATVKTRRFVQTFFLEAQTPHNYTIRNDSLRYLQETSPQVAVAPQPEPKPQPVATPAPTPSTNGTADTHSATAVPAADSNGEAKKQPQEKKKPAVVAGSPTAARKGQGRQPRKTEDKKGKPEQGQEQPAAKPSKPATYANIVSGSAVPTSAPPAAEQPKPKTSAAAPKQQTQPQQAQQQQQQQQQPKPVKEKKPKQEREGHSVYVGNLPFEATSEQVYNLFAKFGSIKDIALKRGYGFVDLASAEDLKKVVDHFTAHPAELDGRPLVIEDRKRGAPKTTNAPRPAQGQSQPKPAGAKRPTKTGGKPADNTAH